jgi:hypothetical protein
MKFCNKCESKKITDGGVQISLNRWLCAKCWTYFAQKKPGQKALASSQPQKLHGVQHT